jgi:hypothetical protein
MNTEPPSDKSHGRDEGVDTESPGRHAGRRPRADGGKGLWISVATIVGVLVVAGGVAAFLFFSKQPEALDEQRSPRRGLACPLLRQAAEAYERDDLAKFDRTIAQAAKVAEDTLQNSGQEFGAPERIALELGLGTRPPIAALLTKAEQVCSDVG